MAKFAQRQTSAVEWTITDSAGNTALPISSFVSAMVTSEGQVVSEAIEAGSFATYNKTAAPIEIKLELAFQGTKAEIQEVLATFETSKEGTEKYSIVTPYHEYQNMTLARFDYDMTADNGLGRVIVNATFEEIKEVAAAFSQVSADAITAAQVSDPSDVSTVDTGQTMTTATTTAEASAAETAGTTARRKSILKSGVEALNYGGG